MKCEQCYVYIMSNHARRLYTGRTTDLARRVWQHRHGTYENSFTKKYRFTKLVYYEVTESLRNAAARERQIKGWSREKKIRLIESINYGWHDLAADWPELADDTRRTLGGC